VSRPLVTVIEAKGGCVGHPGSLDTVTAGSATAELDGVGEACAAP
jgi:hypothetical protein